MAVKKDRFEPHVSIIICAYNEEIHIKSTIENKLELAYPKDKVEIIVVSDASTDSTDAIVKSFGQKRVKLIRQEPRSGKTAAINSAAAAAAGEILIFSDANSLYDPDALKQLVQNFSDAGIGYVTGKMMYINADRSLVGDGCTLYMKYENFLRSVENQTGSIVGVDGGLDAIRRELFRPMCPDQLPDFVLPLEVIERGYRVVYELGAVVREPALTEFEDEYRMRVRVALRSFWAMKEKRRLLGFKLNKFYAFQLWSHKVLRYLCFLFLLGAYFGNIFLFTHGRFFGLFFMFQNLAYLAAIVPLIFGKKGLRFKLMYLFHYFFLINLASGHAFIKFLLNRKQVIWTPRKG
jgi:cellulose synthase/poly-beta-1,6-N-acetylglucosamine synthase-like glycosyltransferase